MFYPCLIPLTQVVSFVVNFVCLLFALFFRDFISSILVVVILFWGLFLFPFLFTWFLLFTFGVTLYLNTFANLILVSFVFYSSTYSTTICCSSGDLDRHLSLVVKNVLVERQCYQLILVYVLAIVVIFLLVLGVTNKLFVSCRQISFQKVLRCSVSPLTSFSERIIVDLGIFIEFINVGVYHVCIFIVKVVPHVGLCGPGVYYGLIK